MRVCSWVDPQPRDFPVSLLECGAAAPPRSVGLCGVVSAVASCPQLSDTVCGTKTNRHNAFEHGSRNNLHHFHDFSTIQGRQRHTRCDSLDHGRRKTDLHNVHDLIHNQRTGWRDTKTLCFAHRKSREGAINKNCENGTVH